MQMYKEEVMTCFYLSKNFPGVEVAKSQTHNEVWQSLSWDLIRSQDLPIMKNWSLVYADINCL
jgi:hypothetical protein